MTVAVGVSGNATELFRANTAHSPSYFALRRAAGGMSSPEGASDIVDFCIPCNPYFPSPAMYEKLRHSMQDILTYYPSSTDVITNELCSLLGLNPQTVAMGNGSTELITWIDHLLVRDSLAIPIPTFGRWTDQPMETGKRVDMFLLPEAAGFALDPAAFVSFVRARGSRTAVICNPNNPDGGFLPKHAVVGLMDALADLDLVVIDESFLDFADAEAWPSVAAEAVLRPNVIVLRSLGKNFGLHGIRFGYMVANPALAGKVRRMLPKWNLNSFAEAVVFMLKDHREEYAQSLRMVARDRQEMIWQLAALPGLTVYPSQGNFVFVKLPDGVDGAVLRDRLLAEHGVLVRECGNKLGSSSRFMRLVVRPQADVQRLLTGLSTVLYGSTWYAATPEAAPAPVPEPAPQIQQLPQIQPAPQPVAVPVPQQLQLQQAQPPQPVYEQPAALPPAPPQPVYEPQRMAPPPVYEPQPMGSQPVYEPQPMGPQPVYEPQPMAAQRQMPLQPQPPQPPAPELYPAAAEVPPAFASSKPGSPRPALYWQDAS
ncbi:aminotransferase class I/II-fold pyridoxal phosphate-dependent enzyme [Streptomyces sp. NPDC058691]|uniref:pyridoxal phosphate-dependent aminotransferase n=1 Tax=Streptomyces sp. NPDC058691 TaxID=3346601 RepID=UPI003661E55E